MPLDVDLIIDPDIGHDDHAHLSRLMTLAAETERCATDGDWSVTVRLTDDSRIAEFHQRYFGDASPTDVISFPSGELLDAPNGHLGDILISVETAARQAVDAGHSPRREVAFLALHGFLHLCGRSDAGAAERSEMLRKQSEILGLYETAVGRPW